MLSSSGEYIVRQMKNKPENNPYDSKKMSGKQLFYSSLFIIAVGIFFFGLMYLVKSLTSN